LERLQALPSFPGPGVYFLPPSSRLFDTLLSDFFYIQIPMFFSFRIIDSPKSFMQLWQERLHEIIITELIVQRLNGLAEDSGFLYFPLWNRGVTGISLDNNCIFGVCFFSL
jgi:hypothetical protein